MTRFISISKKVPIFIRRSNTTQQNASNYRNEDGQEKGVETTEMKFLETTKMHHISYTQYNVGDAVDRHHNFWILHGSYQTRHTWDDFFDIFLRESEEFAKLYPKLSRMIAMDLRGHGESDYTDSYHIHEFSNDLYQFRQQLNHEWKNANQSKRTLNSIQSNPVSDTKSLLEDSSSDLIMGMSLGGLTTLDHWIRYGTGLGGIIVDITPHYKEYELLSPLKDLKFKSFEEWVAWGKMFNPDRTEENLVKRMKYSVMENENKEWVWRADPKFSTFAQYARADNKYYEWIWSQLKNLQPELKNTQVLIIRGGKSKVTTPEEIQELVDVMNFGCNRKWVQWIEIHNAGHSVQGDAPEEFAKIVKDYLHRTLKSNSKL